MAFNTYQDPTSMALLSGQGQRHTSSTDAASAALAQGNTTRQALRTMEQGKDKDRELTGYLARLEAYTKSQLQKAQNLHEKGMQTGEISFLREAMETQERAFNLVHSLNKFKAESATAYQLRSLGGREGFLDKIVRIMETQLDDMRKGRDADRALKVSVAEAEKTKAAEEKLREKKEAEEVLEDAEKPRDVTGQVLPPTLSDAQKDILRRAEKALMYGKTPQEAGIPLDQLAAALKIAKAQNEHRLEQYAGMLKGERKLTPEEEKKLSAAERSAIGRATGLGFAGRLGSDILNWWEPAFREGTRKEGTEFLLTKAQVYHSRLASLRNHYLPEEDAKVAAGEVMQTVVDTVKSGGDPVYALKERLHAFRGSLQADPNTKEIGDGIGSLFLGGPGSGGGQGPSPAQTPVRDIFGLEPENEGVFSLGGSPVVRQGEPGSPITGTPPGQPNQLL